MEEEEFLVVISGLYQRFIRKDLNTPTPPHISYFMGSCVHNNNNNNNQDFLGGNNNNITIEHKT